MEAPRNVKQLRVTLGQMGYYRKFIKAYAQIIVPMEKLLNKDVTLCWDEECQPNIDVLKEKMEYDFEVIVKSGRLNARPNHLSQTETGDEPINLEEGLLDAHIFVRYVPDFEHDSILTEAHGGATGGHYAGNETTQKILCTGLWWATLHKDSKAYFEAFNKILENVLKRICNVKWNDWDVHIPTVLWAYMETYKKLIGKNSFELVYGVEGVVPMEYIVLSLCIAALTDMEDHEVLEEWLTQLKELEEDQFLVGFHQQVQKEHEKSWHDRHIKLCTFKVNDLILLYDSKLTKFLGKF
eukprot:PITA_25288